MDIVNVAFNEVPCCSCGDWRRDFVLARLIMFWLASSAGQKPPVPTRDEIFRNCCRSPQTGITILSPSDGHTNFRNG